MNFCIFLIIFFKILWWFLVSNNYDLKFKLKIKLWSSKAITNYKFIIRDLTH